MVKTGFKAGMVLAVLCAAACSKGSAEQKKGAREAAPKAIKTQAVKQESIRRPLDIVGTLAAEDEVTVSSQAEGVVKRVLADLGDPVSTGQPLVELDREKAEYSLDQQRAEVARALTKYGAADGQSLPQPEDTPDVRKALAALEQAKQQQARAKQLQARQLIPQQSLEDADTALRARLADYDAAVHNARNMRADIDASQAAAKLADRQLRDSFIRAPFSGFVQKRLVSVGELVKGQMPVMAVVRVNPLKLLGEIPERMAPWVKVGQTLTLQVDAYAGKSFSAKVSRISPAVNTSTRTFAFEGLVPNDESLLKPGTFARAHLETDLAEPVVTIPYAAMQYRYGVYRAFVVNGDHLAMHELKTGDRLGDRMEVLDGVKPGDEVAMTDVDNLADGMKIATKDTD